jgi:1,2-phenylacetyl-CoA epoxidase PaaB subunit
VTAWVLERVFRGEEGAKVKDVQSMKKPDIEAAIALALAYHTKRKGSVHIYSVNESGWMQQTRVYK